MKSDNPILQQVIENLNKHNQEVTEWRDNFAEKLMLELNAERQEK